MSSHTHNQASFDAGDQEWLMPIVKSGRGSDGRLWIEGIANDHSADADDEAIHASEDPSCVDYFKRAGIMDYDHHSDEGGPMVGRPTEAKFIAKSEAEKKFPNFKFEGKPLFIRAYVHPNTPDAPADVKELHRLHDVGEQLYFSIKGQRHAGVEFKKGTDGQSVPCFKARRIEKVAITPQPKNTNAPAYFVKSLSALTAPSLAIETVPARICGTPELYSRQSADTIRKSMSASIKKGMDGGDGGMDSGTLTSNSDVYPTDGTTGGDALKVPGMSYLSCRNCKKKNRKSAKHCSECGARLHIDERDALRRAARTVRKSLNRKSLRRHELTGALQVFRKSLAA